MTSHVEPSPVRPSRRAFLYTATWTAVAAGGALAVWPLVDQMNPAGDVIQRTYDLSKIAPGKQLVVDLKGTPIFIRHRTPEEIAAAVGDDDARMVEPQKDAERAVSGRPQWLIVKGSCTFDHCVATIGGGEFKGWFCPCCGSAYDTSGRARTGPATWPYPYRRFASDDSTNMPIPRYQLLPDDKVRLI